MDSIKLKVTRFFELPDNFAKLYVKDNDDNAKMPAVQQQGRYDFLIAIDNNVVMTRFNMVKIEGVEADLMDGDFKCHQLVISYATKETVTNA